LEQSRWEEDPKGMMKVSNEDKEPECPRGFIFGTKDTRQGCLDCEDEEGKIYRRCALKKRENEKKHPDKYEDGIRYVWNDKENSYVHGRTGEIYIP
jgi:hypothetical protein